jgi:hypothetical protein
MKHAHRLTMMWRDDEDFSSPRHGRAAVSQDRQRSIVVPIMDYLFQNVDVSAYRQRIKKAPANNLASVSNARIFEDLTSTRHHIRQVEHTPRKVELDLRIGSGEKVAKDGSAGGPTKVH